MNYITRKFFKMTTKEDPLLIKQL